MEISLQQTRSQEVSCILLSEISHSATEKETDIPGVFAMTSCQIYI